MGNPWLRSKDLLGVKRWLGRACMESMDVFLGGPKLLLFLGKVVWKFDLFHDLVLPDAEQSFDSLLE